MYLNPEHRRSQRQVRRTWHLEQYYIDLETNTAYCCHGCALGWDDEAMFHQHLWARVDLPFTKKTKECG